MLEITCLAAKVTAAAAGYRPPWAGLLHSDSGPFRRLRRCKAGCLVTLVVGMNGPVTDNWVGMRLTMAHRKAVRKSATESTRIGTLVLLSGHS